MVWEWLFASLPGLLILALVVYLLFLWLLPNTSIIETPKSVWDVFLGYLTTLILLPWLLFVLLVLLVGYLSGAFKRER